MFAIKCSLCGQSSSLSIKCAFCSLTFYCSQEHQTLHWKQHKYECKMMTERNQSVQFAVASNNNDDTMSSIQTVMHSNMQGKMQSSSLQTNLQQTWSSTNTTKLSTNTQTEVHENVPLNVSMQGNDTTMFPNMQKNMVLNMQSNLHVPLNVITHGNVTGNIPTCSQNTMNSNASHNLNSNLQNNLHTNINSNLQSSMQGHISPDINNQGLIQPNLSPNHNLLVENIQQNLQTMNTNMQRSIQSGSNSNLGQNIIPLTISEQMLQTFMQNDSNQLESNINQHQNLTFQPIEQQQPQPSHRLQHLQQQQQQQQLQFQQQQQKARQQQLQQQRQLRQEQLQQQAKEQLQRQQQQQLQQQLQLQQMQQQQQNQKQQKQKRQQHQQPQDEIQHSQDKQQEQQQQQQPQQQQQQLQTNQQDTLARQLAQTTACFKSCCTFPIYDMPAGVSKEEIIRRHADYLVKSLTNDGYCVIDGLLGDNKFKTILFEVNMLIRNGMMKEGQLIQGNKTDSSDKIRGDKICWVNGDEDHCKNIKCLMNVVDHLVGYSDGRLKQTIKGRTQAMVACYEGRGIGYKYHIDNAHKDGRCISILYYMNKGWNTEKDGGALRLYPFGSKVGVNIDPVADRLLIFWSDSRTPHEVLPPFKERFAITIWYFDAKEREEVRKTYFANLQKNFASVGN